MQSTGAYHQVDSSSDRRASATAPLAFAPSCRSLALSFGVLLYLRSMPLGRYLLTLATTAVLVVGVLCSQWCALDCAFQGGGSPLASAQAPEPSSPMEHCHGHHGVSRQACDKASDTHEDHQRRDCRHQYPQLVALLPSGSHAATSNGSAPNPPAGCLALAASAGSCGNVDASNTALPLRSPPPLAVISHLRV
jgi:hypothetical protein